MTPAQDANAVDLDGHYLAMIAAHTDCDCTERVPASDGQPERCQQWINFNIGLRDAYLTAAAAKLQQGMP